MNINMKILYYDSFSVVTTLSTAHSTIWYKSQVTAY